MSKHSSDTERNLVESVFEKASDLSGAERGAYVERACDGSDELIEQVLGLLDAEAAASELLREVEADLAASTNAAAATDLSGTKVGQYVIDRLLATGGMGGVYLAHRHDEHFDHQVAIKLLPVGMQLAEFETRFRTERQILAQLNHPNIAHLLDGGVTDDGTPYFVMEYVDGVSLTKFCDTHKLSIKKRLTLFGQVCDAVGKAHRQLVAHRDIKPDNILVTAAGQVKLLDFGVAKLIDNVNPADKTQTNRRMLTPAYASPEQLRGEPVAASCDIYSLGLLLYELLSGVRPYVVDAKNLTDVITGRVHDRLPSMAAALTAPISDDSVPALGDIARDRATSTRELVNVLSGDLNNVALKAMQPQPERRYDSVTAFWDDIDAYLKGKPVTARKPDLSYRVTRFLQRNRLASVFSALLLVTTVAIVVLSVSMAVATSRHAKKVALERDRAQQLTNFLVDMFDYSDPRESGRTDLTARELLDAASSNVETELADVPESRAAIYSVMGRVYNNLRDDEEAQVNLRKSVAVYETLPETDPKAFAQTLSFLASSLLDGGEYDEAIVVSERSVEVGAQINDEPIVPASLYASHSAVLNVAGHIEESMAAARQALELAVGEDEEMLRIRAAALNNLANGNRFVGRYDEAVGQLRAMIDITKTVDGVDHPDLAVGYSNLCGALNNLDRFDEALQAAQESQRIRTAVYGETGMHDVVALIGIAGAYIGLHQWDLALANLDQADTIVNKNANADHPYRAWLLGSKASALIGQGRYDEAEKVVEESRLIIDRSFPQQHRLNARRLQQQAEIFLHQGKLTRAEEKLEAALIMYQTLMPTLTTTIVNLMTIRVKLNIAQGRVAEAKSAIREQHQMILELLGSDSPRLEENARILTSINAVM